MAKKDLQRIDAKGYLHVEDRNMDFIKLLADRYEKLTRLYALFEGDKHELLIEDKELDEKYDLHYLFNKERKGDLQCIISFQMRDCYNLIKEWIDNDKPDFNK
jgi:hypothetical protein